MTLDEFKKRVFDEEEHFITNYRDNAADVPDEWPLEMDEDAWWDQWLAHHTMTLENK